MKDFQVLGQSIGRSRFFVIGGPCVIESEELVLKVAGFLKAACRELGIPFVFKSSYDKANRTSIRSFRGPGIEAGLQILARVREELGIPVLTDVHGAAEAQRAAEVVDVLQIPAFLVRQTDLLVAAGRTGKPVNIKKGQFLAPWDMAHAAGKVRETGNDRILLTERGTLFGYNNLVVDMRSIPIMGASGFPVVFDATHSVQLPGGEGSSSGGQRQYVATLACAAVAAGAHGVFIEMHEDPDKALCDGPNSLPLTEVPALLRKLLHIYNAVSGSPDPEILSSNARQGRK
jgi:2-dehydro-3-deoxyphosphooctonate aldolase (KDO 8-P synthase)